MNWFDKKHKQIIELAKSRFSVSIIKDSVGRETDKRITTFLVKYPRFITPEMLTHRMFSRNSSSSRAIPSKVLRSKIWNEPMLPVEWGANNPGMQSKSLLSPKKAVLSYYIWVLTARMTVFINYVLDKLSVHKQIANRVLEFASPVELVITSTEWANFFALRCHPDAQPEFQHLANEMYLKMVNSNPDVLNAGEWHLPFISEKERSELDLTTCIKVSVARCARTSYKTFDGKTSSVEADVKLYDKLVRGEPKHASPTEHQAMCDSQLEKYGNFTGWHQYRQFLDNQNIKKYKMIG